MSRELEMATVKTVAIETVIRYGLSGRLSLGDALIGAAKLIQAAREHLVVAALEDEAVSDGT